MVSLNSLQCTVMIKMIYQDIVMSQKAASDACACIFVIEIDFISQLGCQHTKLY